MRTPALLLLGLAACGQGAPPPPLPPPPQAAVAPWFICDGIDAPALLVLERDRDDVRVAEYDKPNGAIVARHTFTAGDPEGAAGSVFTPLLSNGAETGAVRQINAGVLETPGAAYTPFFSAVRLGDRDIACRWMPRTRLFGVTGRRSIVVHEDADGDLIYTSYNFTDAAAAHAIELGENGRTTTFSAEVRGGEETTTPDGAAFRFESAGYAYIVTAGRDGAGGVAVRQGGEEVQSEPFAAYQLGAGAP